MAAMRTMRALPRGDAASAGSPWEEERDGESAGGATEIQRAQPPQNRANAQVAATRVKPETKSNAFTAAGRLRPARGTTTSDGGNEGHERRICGGGLARGGDHELKKARQREMPKRWYEKNKERIARRNEENKEDRRHYKKT